MRSPQGNSLAANPNGTPGNDLLALLALCLKNSHSQPISDGW